MWAPIPPRLRPLGVGERIDASFKIFGHNFLNLAKAILVIAIPAGLVQAVITLSSSATVNDSATPTASPFGSTSTTTVLGGFVASYLISYVVGLLASAVCFRIITSSYLGQPTSWRGALGFGVRRIFSVAWIGLLSALGVVAPGILVAVIIVAVAATHAALAAVVVGLLLGLGWLVFAIWFSICARLAIPALMIEGTRGVKSIRRSIRLCRGNWWSVFGTQLLAGLLTFVFGIGVGIVALILLVATRGSVPAETVVNFFIRVLTLTIATPFTAAVLVVLAIDLRVRKEGFDIQLLASQMGMAPTASALSFIRSDRGDYYAGPGAPTFPPGGYPPPQGYPPPGYLPPGYGAPGQPPPQGYLPPGYLPPGYLPPGYGPPGQPPPQGYPPPGYLPPGYGAPPDYPPPPASPAPSGYPPQQPPQPSQGYGPQSGYPPPPSPPPPPPPNEQQPLPPFWGPSTPPAGGHQPPAGPPDDSGTHPTSQ